MADLHESIARARGKDFLVIWLATLEDEVVEILAETFRVSDHSWTILISRALGW